MSEQLSVPYMAYESRERGLRKAELRTEAIRTGNRLAAATDEEVKAARLLVELFDNPATPPETLCDALTALDVRLEEQKSAERTHRAIERQLGW